MEISTTMALIEKPVQKAAKKYIFIKNHVREIPSVGHEISSTSARSRKDSRENEYSSSSSNCELKKNINSHVVIDKSDLEDLQKVYIKCKKIIKKIESKYGHLLNDEELKHDSCRKRKRLSSQNGNNCNCVSNSNVFFDKNGLQVGHELLNDSCVSSSSSINDHNNQILQPNKEPDNLQSLTNILRDPDIETVYLSEDKNKYRYIQEEILTDINLEKPSLLQSAKKDSDEVFKFVGTNLSTLTGYPT